MCIYVEPKNMDNLVLNQHTIPYIHVARTVPIFINLVTWHFAKIQCILHL